MPADPRARPIVIDGSLGEGGGQVLRTSLALALVTGRPLRIERLRARREKPGLRRQHLAALHAAQAIGHAAVEGDALGSTQISFAPEGIEPGDYHFSVGTAGSTSLVLQTVLPALLRLPASSRLVIEGGTHNPLAPPFEFLARAFLPLIARMGPRVDLQLQRHGFYPAGGGRIEATVFPAPALERLTLERRGEIQRIEGRALVCGLPTTIGDRETAVLARRLGLPAEALQTVQIAHAEGPGNLVLVTIESQNVTEVLTAFGQKGVPAETVAQGVAVAARDYLIAEVPVGPYLADQLLIPLALAGGGSFRTVAPTEHARTNAAVIERFLDVAIVFTDDGRRAWRVDVASRRSAGAGEAP